MKPQSLSHPIIRQRGLTMVELLVALAISLVLVLAATYVYLATRQSDRALERSSDAQETGVYVLQLLGREIANAGFYPATRAPIVGNASDPADKDITQVGMIDTYPPLEHSPHRPTDWMNAAAGWPPVAFQTGIFGCDDASFDTAASVCGTTAAGTGDTIVINRVAGEAGDSVDFTPVLLVDGDSVTSAQEDLAKVKVSAEKIEDLRGPKIRILKYKNKTGYKKRQGHRQELTRLKITSIA